MVPVSLKLKNFLSYGTAAPPLDFEQFHVACLSGRNGQGKSALLDAMTWAIWGEARKSSGARKPDDDLIRIGTRHMEVEFVFDVEGERYRVTRTYQRSATGKTTKSDLEFHLYEPGAGNYRPLTGSTQRETQEQIEHAVGLDYDTFINSAFLLQGRSDEFTKKRPSERKEILTRILNLSRYERLARIAAERRRSAKERQRQASVDIERLEEALEQVPGWKRKRKALREDLEQQRERLSQLREEETSLAERRADLDAKAREAESLQQALEALDRRVESYAEEIENLDARIAEAQELLEQEEEIEHEYDRYQTLQEERDELDTKRDLYRGLEKQIEQRKAELTERKNEHERRLHSLEVRRKAEEEALQDCTTKLSKEPAVRQSLKMAREAAERMKRLEEVRARRDEIKERMAELREELAVRHEARTTELRSLKEQIGEVKEEVETLASAPQRVEKLREKVDTFRQLQQKLERTRERGTVLSRQVEKEKGEVETLEEEVEEQREQLETFRAAEDGVCPVCRSELTASHRREVLQSYREDIQVLTERIEKTARQVGHKSQRCEELRDHYRSLKERAEALQEAPAKLAAAREQHKQLQERQKQLQRLEKRADAVAATLENRSFGQALREEWEACKEELQELGFDPETFEEVQKRAAQVERYEEQLRELEEKAGRKEQIEKRLRANREQAAELREALDEGTAFGELPDQIERLEQQLEEVGFDPERFDAVRQQIRELSEAGNRMKDLMHAQQNLSAWKEQRERVQERIEEAADEKEEMQGRLSALEEELKDQPDVQVQLKEKTQLREKAEEEISSLQQQLGQLTAQLERAAEERATLDQRRQEKAEAKAERTLYKHLRTAFGKHGIPSLIIEQTLPEIEERANALLGQLTDGKMSVRLETLKDKKTGGTKETLEIIITDEQGVPRAYETFSGGESFRVNFALRIALAQLLAERNGVRVRTLVIDEGFGTQDQQGVERLVEAIQAIQQDFEKIIVITHLEELKQAFPVRIEVEKDPVEGSSYEIAGI